MNVERVEKTYLNRILWSEIEFQPVCLALVYRVRVDDANVHEPCFEVVSRNECNTRR